MAFKEKGKIVGIEADLAREIEQEIAMTIEFIDMPWDDLEGALNKAHLSLQHRGLVKKIINHWIPLKVEVGQ